MLRLAIVGIGWAGTRQVQAMRELGRKVVVDCIMDNDAQFLAAKAAELGISKTYTDYNAVLADPDVDAVSICTPHVLHREMAWAAAAAKKHILCEKPIALTVEDATRMIEGAEKNGVTLYVAENLTYQPMARFLRELVRAGTYIGELTFATVVNGFQAPNFGYEGRRAWLTLPKLGGTGSWMLHGVHSMAQLRYVLGEVDTIYLREHHAGSFKPKEIEGTMCGLLTMHSGLNVSIVQTCETRLAHNLGGYVIHGDRGTVRAWKDGYEVFSRDLAPSAEPLRLEYPPEQLSEYALEIEAFADHVAGVAAGPTDGRSERRSLAVVQAGYQPISLRERFGQI
jgi:predicted dehydrogenase